tara:strand:+ start:268 stop:720 length:453 start_codon:yes stop_codon:yes gene_type:complete
MEAFKMINVKGADVEEKIKEYQKLVYNKNNKFDIDLGFGEKFEKSVAKILTLDKVEIKTERDTWKKTGNIAVELSSRGKLSGLNTTKADWWCQVLTIKEEIVGVYMVPVKKLKEIVKESVKSGRGRMVMGGDSDTSELALIPLEDLTNGF